MSHISNNQVLGCSIMNVWREFCLQFILRASISRHQCAFISCRRVENYLLDKFMQQFGGIQSINIISLPHDFKQIDWRRKSDCDWEAYYVEFIARWNDRHNYVAPIIYPQGDGKHKLKVYLHRYKSLASINLMMPLSIHQLLSSKRSEAQISAGLCHQVESHLTSFDRWSWWKCKFTPASCW